MYKFLSNSPSIGSISPFDHHFRDGMQRRNKVNAHKFEELLPEEICKDEISISDNT